MLEMPTAIKNVKGKQYLYYSYYDPQDHKKREIYCGQSGTHEAERKALQLELDYLKEQKSNLSKKIKETEIKLRQLT